MVKGNFRAITKRLYLVNPKAGSPRSRRALLPNLASGVCFESSVNGVQLDVGVVMFQVGLTVTLLACFQEEAVVGHEGALMVLHHGLFDFWLSGISRVGRATSVRSVKGRFLVRSIFWCLSCSGSKRSVSGVVRLIARKSDLSCEDLCKSCCKLKSKSESSMFLVASASKNSCHPGSGSNLAFLVGEDDRVELALSCRRSSSSSGVRFCVVAAGVDGTDGTAGASGTSSTGCP